MAGRGHALLRAHGIAVEVGLGAKPRRGAPMPGISAGCATAGPHVTLKLAVSADGKAGPAGRRPARDHRRARRARGCI